VGTSLIENFYSSLASGGQSNMLGSNSHFEIGELFLGEGLSRGISF
jgi:hypothetical protein